jgi:hypothetical protein
MPIVIKNPLLSTPTPLWMKYNKRNLNILGAYKRLLILKNMPEGSGYPAKLSKAYETAKGLLKNNKRVLALINKAGSLPSKNFKIEIVKIAVNKIQDDITPSKLKNFYARQEGEMNKNRIKSLLRKKIAGNRRKEFTVFGNTNFGKGLPTNVFRKIVTSTFH